MRCKHMKQEMQMRAGKYEHPRFYMQCMECGAVTPWFLHRWQARFAARAGGWIGGKS